MQDQDRLADANAFLRVVKEANLPLQICAGHVHRPTCGLVDGIPFATMRSALYQAPPPYPAWDWDNFAPAPEAPALGVISARGGSITIQFEEFCSYSHGT